MTNDKRPPCFDRLDAECFEKQPAWAKQAFAYRLLRLLVPDEITKLLPQSLRELPDLPGLAPDQAQDLQARLGAPPAVPPGVAATGITPPTFVAPATSEPAAQPGKSGPPPAEPPDFTENWNACTVQNYWLPLNTPTAFVADNTGWKYYLDTAAQGGSQLLTYVGYLEPRTYNTISDTYVYIKDTDDFRLRYLTQIKIRTRRASGGGSPLCALWDAAPPGGNLLWSEILTSSSSATYQTWPTPGDFSAYSNLHFGFVLGLGAQRYQRIYKVEIT